MYDMYSRSNYNSYGNLLFLLFLTLPNSLAHGKVEIHHIVEDNIKYTFNYSHSKSSLFHVNAINNPIFVVGDVSIKVCLETGHFNVEVHKNIDQIDNNASYWYILKTLKWWTLLFIRNKASTNCHTIKGLSPYEEKYIRVTAHSPFENKKLTIERSHKVLDPTCFACLVLGLILFTKASTLSQSVLFYYTSSTFLGILASALVLIFILSRFLPQKPLAYTVLLGGWSFCAYFFTKVWNDLTQVLLTYYYYVICYALGTGFLTFAYCYYRGPISNPRTHTVIQWTIQLISLILIYNGTKLREASVGLIVLVVTLHIVKETSFKDKFKRISNKLIHPMLLNFLYKPKITSKRFLSEEEFQRQGRIETEKALEELKSFCQSPECSPWKTLASLESPQRFARFIQGEHHVSPKELSFYDEDMAGIETDDENNPSDLISEDEDGSMDPMPMSDFIK